MMVGALIVAVVWCMGVVLKFDIVEVEDLRGAGFVVALVVI